MYSGNQVKVVFEGGPNSVSELLGTYLYMANNCLLMDVDGVTYMIPLTRVYKIVCVNPRKDQNQANT